MRRLPSNLSKVKASLQEAEREKRKTDDLMKTWNWNEAVVASLHSIRRSVESLFWLVEEEIDSGDPTAKLDLVIEKILEIHRFSRYYQEKLARMRWIVDVWAKTREELIHAYEQDAKTLRDYANEVYHICSQLVALIKPYANRTELRSYAQEPEVG